MKNKKLLYKIFIASFVVLYVFIGAISFMHAIEFFNIGNNTIMSIMLAAGFELGLALSLMSILLSQENRSQATQWILMITLTLVQVIGNVYSVYKHIAISNTEYYIYLQKSLLFWIEEVSPETVQVIISWITGAILPIVALMMTDMVANNIKNLSSLNNPNSEVIPDAEPTIKEEKTEKKIKEKVPNEIEEQRRRINETIQKEQEKNALKEEEVNSAAPEVISIPIEEKEEVKEKKNKVWGWPMNKLTK